VDVNEEALRIPLDGYAMQLRPSELESVAAGLPESAPATLPEALKRLPANDRAPLWELATRHYGRHKPIEQAAGEIGMDPIRAHSLLHAFSEARAQG
jgi:hypothetical protein